MPAVVIGAATPARAATRRRSPATFTKSYSDPSRQTNRLAGLMSRCTRPKRVRFRERQARLLEQEHDSLRRQRTVAFDHPLQVHAAQPLHHVVEAAAFGDAEVDTAARCAATAAPPSLAPRARSAGAGCGHPRRRRAPPRERSSRPPAAPAADAARARLRPCLPSRAARSSCSCRRAHRCRAVARQSREPGPGSTASANPSTLRSSRRLPGQR